MGTDNIGETIKEIRTSKGISTYSLSEMTGISQSTLSKLENGKRKADIEILKIIAPALGVPVTRLLDGESIHQMVNNELSELKDNLDKVSNFIKINNITKIPVLGIIRAGEPIYAEQNILDYMILPDQYNDGEYFGLKVTGNSMNLSQIAEGSTVIVRRQEHVENGEIAVVLVDGENATLKRFYQTDTTVTLVPHSSDPSNQPRLIDLSKTEVKVIGKAVEVLIKL